MCDLHEEPADQCHSNVGVELALILGRDKVEIEPLHRALNLIPDILRLSKCAGREVVIPCPILVMLIYNQEPT